MAVVGKNRNDTAVWPSAVTEEKRESKGYENERNIRVPTTVANRRAKNDKNDAFNDKQSKNRKAKNWGALEILESRGQETAVVKPLTKSPMPAHHQRDTSTWAAGAALTQKNKNSASP